MFPSGTKVHSKSEQVIESERRSGFGQSPTSVGQGSEHF